MKQAMQLGGMSSPLQRLPLLLLAALSSPPLCRAERAALNINTVTHPPTEYPQNPQSPKEKQPLYKMVATFLHGNNSYHKTDTSEGTSLAETLTVEGSCDRRTVWEFTETPMLGKGAYAEIYEVRKRGCTSPCEVFALKKAMTSKHGVPLSHDRAENAKKDVEAEAELLASVHDNFKKAGKGDRCPNVVPVISQLPCVYDTRRKVAVPVSGAYVTIKMGGDLFGWSKKYSPDTCGARQGKDEFRKQLLDGLNCVHVYGKFAHQDLKADNVLYDETDSNKCPKNLYIADLGLSEPLGTKAGFFDPEDEFSSGHLVTDVFGSTSNLAIQYYETSRWATVWEDIAWKPGATYHIPGTARIGQRNVGQANSCEDAQKKTSRLIDCEAGMSWKTKKAGYTVDRRIDYCSLLEMVWSTFGWGIFIPGYESSSKLNCGKMENDRKTTYTGDDR